MFLSNLRVFIWTLFFLFLIPLLSVVDALSQLFKRAYEAAQEAEIHLQEELLRNKLWKH